MTIGRRISAWMLEDLVPFTPIYLRKHVATYYVKNVYRPRHEVCFGHEGLEFRNAYGAVLRFIAQNAGLANVTKPLPSPSSKVCWSQGASERCRSCGRPDP